MTTYSISPTSPSISENAGSETFTVTRSNTSQSATVYVSTVQDQGSSNTNNEFYNGLSNDQITFAAGQASVQVPLTINDAHLTSGSETFRLIVQQNPTDPVTTSLASDNFTILNNDSGGGNSNEGIDYRSKSSTSSSLTGIDVPAMKSDGYSFVGEYIGSASNQGYLTSADVSVLAQQNIPIVSIFERDPTTIEYFTSSQADSDSADAISAAKNVVNQPLGTTIYFTIDPALESNVYSGSGPLPQSYISAIDGYFTELNRDFSEQGDPYKIGVYGPGDALTSLHSLGLTDLAYYWVDNHWGGTSYSTPNIERDLNGVSASPTSIGVQVDTDTSFGSEFGQWTTGVSTPGPGVVLSDFNGDGTSDILWRNDTNGQVLDWQMSNGTKQKGILFATPGSTLSFVGVGDFNGDGTSDILWQNNNGSLSEWVMVDGARTKTLALGSPGSAWSFQGIGDFNGDGTSDILWRNDTNGQVLDWQMSNDTKQKGILFATPGSTLSFVGVGDFNGDGTSDILWRNSNGGLSEWVMVDGAHTKTLALGSPGSAWSFDKTTSLIAQS